MLSLRGLVTVTCKNLEAPSVFMQTVVILLGLLSTHKQWSIDKNPAIPTLPSRLVVTALIMEIGYLSHFPVPNSCRNNAHITEMKENFLARLHFLHGGCFKFKCVLAGPGKGVGQDMRARAVLCYNTIERQS